MLWFRSAFGFTTFNMSTICCCQEFDNFSFEMNVEPLLSFFNLLASNSVPIEISVLEVTRRSDEITQHFADFYDISIGWFGAT